MKRLVNTLGAIGFVGISFLAGCISTPKSFDKQYGDLLIISRYENDIIFGYDRDKDKKIDLKLRYRPIGYDEEGFGIFKLIGIADDKNRDGDFEDPGEVINFE